MNEIIENILLDDGLGSLFILLIISVSSYARNY